MLSYSLSACSWRILSPVERNVWAAHPLPRLCRVSPLEVTRGGVDFLSLKPVRRVLLVKVQREALAESSVVFGRVFR